jgi:hypothetical protein
MTQTPPSQPTPPHDERDPVSTAPLRRRRRLWVAAAVVIGLCILVPLVILQTLRPPTTAGASPEQQQQHQRLLQLGAALKQYATAHDNALPEQVPPGAAGAAAGATYRAVTPSGERLRYEQFGDRIVAWTEPDAHGRRAVLLNSLDEVERVADANLNLTEQQRTDGGALNRVRIVVSEGEGEFEEEEAAPATASAASAPATKEGE